jgi:hypothetical protein
MIRPSRVKINTIPTLQRMADLTIQRFNDSTFAKR